MEQQTLWRYYDLVKFMTLINGELYFPRADKFFDKYEGYIPKKNLESYINGMVYGRSKDEINRIKNEFTNVFKERRKKVAISCWHIGDVESEVMWKSYTAKGFGIAVKSSISKLSRVKPLKGYKIESAKVQYIDINKEYKSELPYLELQSFALKRLEFSYEKEYRLMLFSENQSVADCHYNNSDNGLDISELVKRKLRSKLNEISEEGLKIKVNPDDLIDEIIASPDMKSYEVEEIQKYLNLVNKSRKSNFSIKKSTLYDECIY